MNITVTFLNSVPGSIHANLKAKLGREPTNAELREALASILRAAKTKSA